MALYEALNRIVVVSKVLYKTGASTTLVEVTSCRMFAEDSECISATALKALLRDTAVSKAISNSGFAYSVEDSTRSVDGHVEPILSDEMAVAISCFLFIGGFAMGVVFQCSQPAPMVRQSARSRPGSQMGSRMGSRRITGQSNTSAQIWADTGEALSVEARSPRGYLPPDIGVESVESGPEAAVTTPAAMYDELIHNQMATDGTPDAQPSALPSSVPACPVVAASIVPKKSAVL